jgi:dienelactone hydrolase
VLAPDALTPLGGYPGDEDKARGLFAKLDQTKTREDFAATDDRINAAWPAYEAALKTAGVRYTAHQYAGTQHGFNNDTTPRFDAPAAKLAWERTLAFFNQTLRT